MSESKYDYQSTRLAMGEAYMICSDCNQRCWSFDGNEDKVMRCPYKGTPKGKEYGCEK